MLWTEEKKKIAVYGGYLLFPNRLFMGARVGVCIDVTRCCFNLNA